MEYQMFDEPQFKHPFTCLIAGPTSSGKTVFTTKCIKYIDELVTPKILDIVYCYSIWQPEYEKMKTNSRINFLKGLPEFESLPLGLNRLVIIDDMISELNSDIETMFIRGSHHYNCSIMVITQNLFSREKIYRNLSLNSHYIVCFKQPRDASQIMHLARQFSPCNTRYVIDAFYKATQSAFSYLLFDFRQDTSELLRLRTKIFPDENLVVFVPQK